MIKSMRWTIARKVGGTVFILLTVILGLLVHSILALNEIEVELKEIAEIDLPLTEHVNEIEIYQLEQRILMDEYIREILSGEDDHTSIKQGITQWGSKTNAQFEQAIIVSKKGLSSSSSKELTDIFTMLNTLQVQHKQIETLLDKLINSKFSPGRLDEIILQDERFDHLTIELIHAVEKLTNRKAQMVVKHEKQFALITYSLGGIGLIIGTSLAVLIIFSIKASISHISNNINLVSSAIKSNRDIPIEQVARVKSTDELSELSDNLANMIEQVSTDISQREENTKALNEMAITDHLTQCFNRLKWDESLSFEVAESLHSNSPLSLIFFDIDHFKKINDSYGHDIGDITLIEVVKIAQENIRQLDTLYRTGGEEFSVLLPNSKQQDATQLAERIRQAIADHRFESVGTLTISLGVTVFRTEGDSSSAFAKRADMALYQSKGAGRNKVTVLV